MTYASGGPEGVAGETTEAEEHTQTIEVTPVQFQANHRGDSATRA